MIWHDVEQNTPEWNSLRVGRITSSPLSKVMANFGRAFGEPAKKYAAELALGQITGKVSSGGYTNGHMDRGHEEEPLAREAYEDRYMTVVTNGGFYATEDTGSSPDGLCGDDGMVEIKSAIIPIHYARIAKQSFDAAYKWQLSSALLFSGRDWIDFISYCADFPEGKQIYVYRCQREDFTTEFEQIGIRLDEFRALIQSAKDVILNNDYSIVGI